LRLIPFMKIGVAGYMGSGKSTFARFIAGHGAKVVNADEVAKQIIRTRPRIRMKLIESFGPDIEERAEINYDLLGNRAFASLRSLERLNGIVHPPLLRELKTLCGKKTGVVTVLDAALIPLWNIDPWFDYLIWIHAPFKERIKRMAAKSVLPGHLLRERMLLQQKLFEPPSGGAWTVLNNSGPEDELRMHAEKLARHYLK
jgi:dephospho-CoA kinase